MEEFSLVDVIAVCFSIMAVIIMIVYLIKNEQPKSLNSEKVENIQGPVFVVSKVEKHNDLYAKYTVENNFSKGSSGGYTYNKFTFFDTRGKYNIGDYLNFTKIVSV